MSNYNIQIQQYQEAFVNNLQSRLIRKATEELTGIELSTEQLMYLTCVLNTRNDYLRNKKASEYIDIPVQYLFHLMTPFTTDDYYKRFSKEYMAGITHKCIEPLQSVVKHTGYNENYCRKFTISKELI